MLPLLVSITGFLFSLAARSGGLGGYCSDSACELTFTFTILNISLWYWGAGFFAATVILLLLRKKKTAYQLTLAALIIDSLLLALMFFLLPCLLCLVVGLILLLLFFSLYLSLEEATAKPKIVLVVWVFFFAPNFMAVMEGASTPWPIYQGAKAQTVIYFSPTCPACKSVITRFATEAEDALVLYPIVNSPGDYDKLIAMARMLESGRRLTEVLHALEQKTPMAEDLPFSDRLQFGWRLLRNKIHLSRIGSGRVPLVIFNPGLINMIR